MNCIETNSTEAAATTKLVNGGQSCIKAGLALRPVEWGREENKELDLGLYWRKYDIHLLTIGAQRSKGYCSCPVCMCVCMYVCPLISAASHIGITQQGYQRVHSNTAIVFNFANFPKNASFKRYGVICLPQAAPFFPQEISFYPSVKPIAYSYVFTA